MMGWVWLALSIAFEVTGTLSLRASEGFRKPRWVVALAFSYASAFFFLALALQTGMPVGVAYGLWTAIGIVLIALLAQQIWAESITRRMLLGMLVIIVGVFLVELG